MAEYSRIMTGQVVSNGAFTTAVVLPFIPNYIELSNQTRAAAASGVTRAWWETDMGQGAAFATTTSGGSDLTSFITTTTGTGFKTIKAGLALQYGPTFFLGASGGIVGTSSTVTTITTTAAHGLTTGNWVVFQNLYQTATTGMQQFAGIPFMVTVTSSTVFTINWNASTSAYTTIATGGLNTLASFKQIYHPVIYSPEDSFIAGISTTLGVTTVVTTAPHNLKIGSEFAFRIPIQWGPYQLNSLPDVYVPGKPIYYYVDTVPTSTTFTIYGFVPPYTAYTANQPFTSFPGQKFPQVVPVGDVNTGGKQLSLGSQLYPSPTVFNGYTGSTTVPVSTINGPAIEGAFINATFQGFVFGSGVGGTAADVISWRAMMSDLNL